MLLRRATHQEPPWEPWKCHDRLVTRLENRGLLTRVLCVDDRRGISTELTQVERRLSRPPGRPTTARSKRGSTRPMASLSSHRSSGPCTASPSARS